MPLTFGDLKSPPSTLPAKVNLCPTDPRFGDLCNRAHSVLLEHGSWVGTEQEANLSILDSCFVLPGCVETPLGIRACDQPLKLENEWYRLTPGFNPQRWVGCGTAMWFEYRDNVPWFHPIPKNHPAILRCFCNSSRDYGKKFKFIGYDKNGTWVRTVQNSVMQDGESVVLATPFVDTVTEWSSVTAVISDERDDAVRVFSHPFVNDVLTAFGLYEYWETRPSYQRWKVVSADNLSRADCCPRNQVIARVKLQFIPVKYDDDLFLIQNRQAMEYAVQAMKAIDDGNNALADTLLYGSRENLRIGAIPLLEQELRSNGGDRFTGNVMVPGTRATRRQMCGFL